MNRAGTIVLTALLSLILGLATPTGAPAASATRTSLTDVEDQVMCVVCHTPLAVSESPQANAERTYIRSLIAQGLTKTQIERALVTQYGPTVLALPPAHGLNLTVYLLPPAALLAGAGGLALALPRWRRRSRSAAANPTTGPSPDPGDARRLDEELARFDG